MRREGNREGKTDRHTQKENMYPVIISVTRHALLESFLDKDRLLLITHLFVSHLLRGGASRENRALGDKDVDQIQDA